MRDLPRLWQTAFVVSLAIPAFGAFADPTDDQRAKDLAAAGTDLFANGDAKGGEAKLEQAWAIKKTADIAGNLGSVELELKEYDRAANHLSYCDRHLPVSTPAEERDRLRTQLAEAKKYVGVLALDVHPDGVEIDIDGDNAGRSPLEGPVFVNPGAHKIVAKRDGLITKELSLTVQAQEELNQKLVLEPAALPPPKRRSPVPGAVVLGLGGASLVVGATLLGLTVPKDHEARMLGRNLICAPTQMEPGCAELTHVVSTRNSFVYAGWFTASMGAVLAVSGVTYFAWPYSSDRKAKVAVVPNPSPDSPGVLVAGSF
jgi:hypothetical protein